jgi:hypothetical protein
MASEIASLSHTRAEANLRFTDVLVVCFSLVMTFMLVVSFETCSLFWIRWNVTRG